MSRQEEVRHYLNVVKPALLVAENESAAETVQHNNALNLPDSMLKIVASSDRPAQNGWTSLHDILTETPQQTTLREIEDDRTSVVMDEVILIIFASGTSGLPKACPHTNMTLWTSYQAASWLRPFGPNDRVVQHLPSSHSFTCLDMIQCWSDGVAVVYPAKTFDAKATLDAIEILQCTYMSG